MAIDTKKVFARRPLRYDSYQDLVNDAERLAACDVRSLGNWSPGQTLGHLARAMELSIDGADFKASWLVRLAARIFYRQRCISGPMPPGIRLPREAQALLVPEEVDVQTALAELRLAVLRLQHDTERAPHPVFGEMSLDEWDSFHLRHAELHMSFLVAQAAPMAVEAAF
ncbi:MAG TPA: DUF1569 domain-containing protein [Pirellulales bacterium]|jgi:hypothetical protein|nr:DUF1569 domain-containing protein [Pirellulales bacterium]